MKLVYWEALRNFGDLNEYVWPKVMLGVIDDDPRTAFYGIGRLSPGAALHARCSRGWRGYRTTRDGERSSPLSPWPPDRRPRWGPVFPVEMSAQR
jgi:hypothetical protein